MKMKWNLVLIVFIMASLGCSSNDSADNSIEKNGLYQTWWKGELKYARGSSYDVTFFFEDEKAGEARIVDKKYPLDIKEEWFTYEKKDRILNFKINVIGHIGGNWLIRTMNDKELILERKTGPDPKAATLYLSRDE